MTYRYCANQIADIEAFKQTISNMGGTLASRPIFHDGHYQCWFDLDQKLVHGEAMTFMVLQHGFVDIVPIKVQVF